MVAYSGIDAKTQSLFSAYNVPTNIASAIKSAGAKTGVDFTYLVEKAAAESGFDATAKSKTSSATGLYQFIDSTWLATVKEHGAEHGLSQYADAIIKKDNGTYSVSDTATKQKILALRNDPAVSSLMAAEYASDNKEYLQNSVPGKIGNTDLYLAHFMGANGAAKFLNEKSENGNQVAATLFPGAAKANRNVFYDESGKARTLNEIYNFFDKKFDGTTPVPATTDTKTAGTFSVDGIKERAYDLLMKSYPSMAGFVSSNSPGVTTHDWNGLLNRISAVEGDDKELADRIQNGGVLSPGTMMYMAALNITDESDFNDEEKGAAKWLKNDDESGKGAEKSVI